MFYHIKILLFCLLFNIVKCVPFKIQRCTTTDCSHQLNPFQNGSCLIHNTTVSMYYMSYFAQSPEVKLKYEEDAKFSITVTPFVAEIYVTSITLRSPAINVTFTIHKEGITALAVKLIKQNTTTEDTPVCRIFDFTGYNSTFILPLDVFYDCFYNMNDFQNIRMDFIALPTNELLSYYTSVPLTPTSYPINNICDWQPVIMVFCGRLSSGVVAVKFSQAPQHFHVSQYSTELIRNTSRTFSVTVPSEEMNSGMLSVKFSSVDSGYYSVVVKPLGDGFSCVGTEFGTFKVEYSKRGVVAEVIAVCIILLLSLLVICGFVFYKWSKKSMQLDVKRALLIVSHDCPAHKDFVNTLIYYFTHKCNLITRSIYGEVGELLDPDTFITDKYHESDIIIYLISEGLLITMSRLLCKDHSDAGKQLKEFHPWKGHLQNAVQRIFNIRSDSRTSNKKVCKLIFPYARQLDIPKHVYSETGVSFKLPEQLNDFLNFVYDCHPIISCFLPTLCEDIESSEEGRDLLEKMNLVQEKVEIGKHLEFEPDRTNNNSYIESNLNSSSTSSCSTINNTFNISSSEVYVESSHKHLADNDGVSGRDNSDIVSQYSDVSGSIDEANAGDRLLNPDQNSSSDESLDVVNFQFDVQNIMKNKRLFEED